MNEYLSYIKCLYKNTFSMKEEDTFFESMYHTTVFILLFIIIGIAFVEWYLDPSRIRLTLLFVTLAFIPYLYRKYISKTLDDLLKE